MDPRWSSWNTAPLISPSLLTPTLKQTQSTQAAAALCKRAVDSLLPCFVLHASSAFLKIINQRPTKLTLSLYPEKSHPGTLCSNICSHAISSGSGGCQVGWQPKARKRKAGWVNGRPYLQESGLGRDTDFDGVVREEFWWESVCGETWISRGREKLWNDLEDCSRVTEQVGLGLHRTVWPRDLWWCLCSRRLHW